MPFALNRIKQKIEQMIWLNVSWHVINETQVIINTVAP